MRGHLVADPAPGGAVRGPGPGPHVAEPPLGHGGGAAEVGRHDGEVEVAAVPVQRAQGRVVVRLIFDRERWSPRFHFSRLLFCLFGRHYCRNWGRHLEGDSDRTGMRKNSFLSIFPPELLLCRVDLLLNRCASYTALRMLLLSLLVQFQIIITLMRNHHQRADPNNYIRVWSLDSLFLSCNLWVVRRKVNHIFSLFRQTSLFVCNHRLFPSQNLRELRRWSSFVCCKWRKIMVKDSQKRRKREVGEKSRITKSDRLSWDKKSVK